MKTLEARFWSKVQKGSDCWEWTGAKTTTGYGVLGRGSRGAGNVRAPHVAIFLASDEWPTQGMYVCHACDNPGCVNPAHLRVDTPKANSNDAKLRGRAVAPPRAYGTANNSTRLSMTEATAIRHLARDLGVSWRAIGRLYGVAHSSIRQIVRRETFYHGR